MTLHDSFSDYAERLRDLIRADSPSLSSEPQFNALALELFALQFQHNSAYRRLCEARDLTPPLIRRWRDIPAAPTVAFKELDLTCITPAERTAVFHSSGTTQQRPSRHFHHARSLELYEESLRARFLPHLLPDLPAGGHMDLLLLAPSRSLAPHSSLAHMMETVRRDFGSSQSHFAGQLDATGTWEINLDVALAALDSAVRQNRPLLILGTAFLFVNFLDALDMRRRRFVLPAGSRVMETGGYKSRTRTLLPAQLHALIRDHLGVPLEGIVCEYGMSELSSQAYDRTAFATESRGHFQFPSWTRTRLISPETGGEGAENEPGLLRIFDLANVWSVLAVQTEDLILRHGDGFELLGRSVLAESRGCSLMTA